MADTVSDIALDRALLISMFPVSIRSLESSQTPFMQNVREEAIAL
jgi:hypothetical protein